MAYGTFESVYGLSFLFGNTLAGLLYEYSISLVVLYVLLAEALSLLALAKVLRPKE
jgi:predicted MFS family arabinose efflux permease